MNINLERQLQDRIIRKLISLFIQNGYLISVNDGEETTLKLSHDQKAIFEAMQSTDGDVLIISLPTGERKGWVSLIYGNDPWEVVNDYTTNLEDVMGLHTTYCDKIEERHGQ